MVASGTMPFGHTKKQSVPVLWKVLQLFKGREEVVWCGGIKIRPKIWGDLVGVGKGLWTQEKRSGAQGISGVGEGVGRARTGGPQSVLCLQGPLPPLGNPIPHLVTCFNNSLLIVNCFNNSLGRPGIGKSLDETLHLTTIVTCDCSWQAPFWLYLEDYLYHITLNEIKITASVHHSSHRCGIYQRSCGCSG